MEHEPLSSEPVDSVLEQNQRSEAHQSRRPVPPSWSESTGYPSWLPSAPWKIDGDPDDVPGDGKHWESPRKLVEDFDAATVAGWKDEVQTQLLVASLLAAVTGAFVIETQKQLSEDPAVTTAFILTQIAMQLNQSMVIPATTVAPFDRPSPTSRAVNSLYFASLGFSLANVTIGLLCLQWLRGLAAQPQGISAQNFLLFRYRRYRAFQEWGAKGMILTLPLLLLASLMSFFGALLISTSSVDWAVATPLYVILISALIVLLFTTFTPAIAILWNVIFTDSWPETITFPPFHSLQSWVILQGLLKFKLLLEFIFDLSMEASLPVIDSAPDWVAVDQFWADWLGSPTQRRVNALFPLSLSFGKTNDRDALYHCYSDLLPSDVVKPGGRRLEVYRHIAKQVPKINGSTLLQVQNQLIRHFVGLLNSGKHLTDFGSLQVEVNMDCFFISADALMQCMHNLIQTLGRDSSSRLVKGGWELLWKLMIECLNHGDEPDLCQPWTIPPLFKDVFDLVEQHFGERHSLVLGKAFSYFICELGYRAEKPFHQNTPVGRRAITTVVHHPVWPQLCELAQKNDLDETLCEWMQFLSEHVASQFPDDDLDSRVGEPCSRTSSLFPRDLEPLRAPDERQSEHQCTISTGTSSCTSRLHPQQSPPSQSPSDSLYPLVDSMAQGPVGPSTLHDITPYFPLHDDDDDDQRKAPTMSDDSRTKQPPLSLLSSQLPPTLDLGRLSEDVGHPTLSGASAIVAIDAGDLPEEHPPPPHSIVDMHESAGQEWIGLASRSSRTRSPDVESGQTPMDQIRDI